MTGQPSGSPIASTGASRNASTIASTDSLRDKIQSFLKVSLSHLPPEVCFIRQDEEDGYKRILLRYQAPDGEQIEAFLFQPMSGEPSGAVLALHQHNSQWTIGKSEIAGLTGDPLQAFGPALARRGITVLAPDLVGFESRMKSDGGGATLAPSLGKEHSSPEGWLQYYNHMAHRLVHGDLLMTKLLTDCAAALAVLQDQTKSSHLGVVGHSFGGIVTLFLAALDTRVAFSCTSGAVCSYRYKLAAGTGLDMSLVIPGFAGHFDFDDLLRCVAPRRIFVVSSTADPYSGDAEDMVTNALPAFETQGRADHLQHLRVAGQHALDRQRFEAISNWIAIEAACS
jgi:dienelactone hydrolase